MHMNGVKSEMKTRNQKIDYENLPLLSREGNPNASHYDYATNSFLSEKGGD